VTLTLVIGGTRSGKSRYAERVALAAGLPVLYVATADATDSSMAARIAAHAVRRPAGWSTAEAGDDLVGVLAGEGVSLIDGLGVWIAGVLHRGQAGAEHVRRQVEGLIEAAARSDVIVVAEEAGQGVLPGDAESRAWLDLLGDSVQRLSEASERVELVVAGRAIALGGRAAIDGAGPEAPGGRRAGAGPFTPGGRPAGAAPPAPNGSLRHHGDRDLRPGDADHAVNVLAGGPPPWLSDALAAALAGAAERYPDESEATSALAALHGRDPAEIVPTNGAAEALWLLGPALRPRLAACVHPGFTEAEAALHAHGIDVTRVQRDPASGFALDPAAVPSDADLVIVGNPASPSGTLDPATALLALRAPGRVLAVDEAFMTMLPGEPGSLAGERLDDVIVVRSLTKLLAIPGLRAGYAIAPRALADRLRAVRPPWSANTLALAALQAAAAHPEALVALAERAAAERVDLEHRLRAIDGVRSWPSATNFCLVEVDDGPGVVAALRAQRIAVRPAGSFPGLGPGHLRITARDPARNERIATALAQAISRA
jgi:histidinol-phosphate/aromatic aminotransferase/cobyric acid decarboxylase-like protein/adenosyl cobinamide kinase/adenosyl cobinamide phosphate guanylyltransferase